ncbi:resuscitation-promoting factor [Nocardioides solisilvae]|uniref:resuscitation-promoting factor n=1 Tax=Nocardioides solisilvae TaxID=1542435 RepID=UPI000D740758|nr:resuscitation-promoting factor [Nocardioides solisilvae]
MRDKIAQLSRSTPLLASLVALVAVALVGTTLGYSALTKSVTLTLDGETREVTAMGDTVADVLAAEGIEVGARDEVAPSLDAEVRDGSEVTVAFGRPLELVVDGESETHWVTAADVDGALAQIGARFRGADLSASRSASIRRDGMELEVVTPKRVAVAVAGRKAKRHQVPALTVAEVLDELGIRVDADDVVKPAPRRAVEPGDRITVTRVKVLRKQVKGEEIAFRTVEREDADLFEGEEETVREGRTGLRDVTYRLRYENGELVDRTAVDTTVRRKPVDATVRVGTKSSGANFADGGTVWDRLAQCESGGNWAINTGNGYYGGVQFSAATWRSVGGSGLPHQHSREEQIKRASILQARAGWGQWPHCSAQLGLR